MLRLTVYNEYIYNGQTTIDIMCTSCHMYNAYCSINTWPCMGFNPDAHTAIGTLCLWYNICKEDNPLTVYPQGSKSSI